MKHATQVLRTGILLYKRLIRAQTIQEGIRTARALSPATPIGTASRLPPLLLPLLLLCCCCCHISWRKPASQAGTYRILRLWQCLQLQRLKLAPGGPRPQLHPQRHGQLGGSALHGITQQGGHLCKRWRFRGQGRLTVRIFWQFACLQMVCGTDATTPSFAALWSLIDRTRCRRSARTSTSSSSCTMFTSCASSLGSRACRASIARLATSAAEPCTAKAQKVASNAMGGTWQAQAYNMGSCHNIARLLYKFACDAQTLPSLGPAFGPPGPLC